jgi:hypothetical protein
MIVIAKIILHGICIKELKEEVDEKRYVVCNFYMRITSLFFIGLKFPIRKD